MNRRMIIVGAVMIALATCVDTGHAQVEVNIGINLPAPPSFVIIPGTPIAYAPAVAANVFFYGGQYWVFANDAWYAGPTYGGPWVVVGPPYIPLPLLTVPVGYFRAPPPYWKHWRRDAPPRWNPAWGHEWHKANADWDKQWDWNKAYKSHARDEQKWIKEQEKHAKQMEQHEGKGHGHPK
jgi:hypothetical protein